VFGRKKLPVQVRRLKLEPGDILVLKYDGRLSRADCYALKERVEAITGHRAMALTDGMDLDVLSVALYSAPAPLSDAEVNELKERWTAMHPNGHVPRVFYDGPSLTGALVKGGEVYVRASREFAERGARVIRRFIQRRWGVRLTRWLWGPRHPNREVETMGARRIGFGGTEYVGSETQWLR
jgi:hypothetical protein